MILDKAYSLKLLKQLTQQLEELMLGTPDKQLMDKEKSIDVLIEDVFKLKTAELRTKSVQDMILMIEQQELSAQPKFYEGLGNLFYYYSKKEEDPELAQKAKALYQKYLQASGIFSLPIIQRINSIQ